MFWGLLLINKIYLYYLLFVGKFIYIQVFLNFILTNAVCHYFCYSPNLCSFILRWSILCSYYQHLKLTVGQISQTKLQFFVLQILLFFFIFFYQNIYVCILNWKWGYSYVLIYKYVSNNFLWTFVFNEQSTGWRKNKQKQNNNSTIR